MPANGRLTINVETVSPLLANTPVSTMISADRGIIVERAMYWPDIAQGWQEAHNSFGAPTSRLNVQASLVPGLGEGFFSADVRVLNYQPIAVEKATYWNAEGVVWARGTNVTATRLPPP